MQQFLIELVNMLNFPKILVCTVLVAVVVARAKSVYETKVQGEAVVEEHQRRMRTVIGNAFVN